MTSILTQAGLARFLQTYAVLIMIAVLIVALSLLSDSFLTFRNLQNILNQNAPLAIMACAMTLVIIGGGSTCPSAQFLRLQVCPRPGLHSMSTRSSVWRSRRLSAWHSAR